MADRPFVHLHCHTHYSLLDGASRVPELVQVAKGHGMNAIAMTVANPKPSQTTMSGYNATSGVE